MDEQARGTESRNREALIWDLQEKIRVLELQVRDLTETLLWIRAHHPHVWFGPDAFPGKCSVCIAIDKVSLTEKQSQAPQYYCEKCGYMGPVEYPHQRFPFPETEFCRERAKLSHVGQKRKEGS